MKAPKDGLIITICVVSLLLVIFIPSSPHTQVRKTIEPNVVKEEVLITTYLDQCRTGNLTNLDELDDLLNHWPNKYIAIKELENMRQEVALQKALDLLLVVRQGLGRLGDVSKVERYAREAGRTIQGLGVPEKDWVKCRQAELHQARAMARSNDPYLMRQVLDAVSYRLYGLGQLQLTPTEWEKVRTSYQSD